MFRAAKKKSPLLPVPSQHRQWTPKCCMFFISLSTAVALGRPLFLLPSGIQWSAVLVIVCSSLHKTSPRHVHHLLVMIASMCSCLHLLRRFSLRTFSCHNILRILRRHVVLKEWRLIDWSSSSSSNRTDNIVATTHLWYNFSLVLVRRSPDIVHAFEYISGLS